MFRVAASALVEGWKNGHCAPAGVCASCKAPAVRQASCTQAHAHHESCAWPPMLPQSLGKTEEANKVLHMAVFSLEKMAAGGEHSLVTAGMDLTL